MNDETITEVMIEGKKLSGQLYSYAGKPVHKIHNTVLSQTDITIMYIIK